MLVVFHVEVVWSRQDTETGIDVCKLSEKNFLRTQLGPKRPTESGRLLPCCQVGAWHPIRQVDLVRLPRLPAIRGSDSSLGSCDTSPSSPLRLENIGINLDPALEPVLGQQKVKDASPTLALLAYHCSHADGCLYHLLPPWLSIAIMVMLIS